MTQPPTERIREFLRALLVVTALITWVVITISAVLATLVR